MKHLFQAIGSDSVIDTAAGVIRGVSLIRLGIADGHFDKQGRQETIDETTLAQVFQYCKGEKSIKVKADHGSGVLATIGYVDNFSLTSDCVRADFHVYESEPQAPRLFEIASKNPHHMGISLEFEGEDKPEGKNTLVRCERVITAAIVSDPAANRSLFSVPDGTDEIENEKATPQNTTTKMDEVDTTQKEDEKVLTADERIDELSKKFEDFAAKFAKKFGEDEPDGDETVVVVPGVDTPKPEADEEKEFSAKLEKAAELGAQKAIKAFSAKLGTTNLGKPGAASETAPKEKHFEEIVSELATKEYNGDTTKARGYILSNLSKNADWSKSYAASRNLKTA